MKTVSELTQILETGKLYNRQEVSSIVGCIWQNVLDASRGEKAKLFGTLVKEGKVSTWYYDKEQILAWRRSVETRTRPKNPFTCEITFTSHEEACAFEALRTEIYARVKEIIPLQKEENGQK